MKITLAADFPGEQQFVATTKVMIINRLQEETQAEDQGGLHAEVLLSEAGGWIPAAVFQPTSVVLSAAREGESVEYAIDQLAAIRFRQ